MARNKSLNHRNSHFRPQTSDLIFALQYNNITVFFEKQHSFAVLGMYLCYLKIGGFNLLL